MRGEMTMDILTLLLEKDQDTYYDMRNIVRTGIQDEQNKTEIQQNMTAYCLEKATDLIAELVQVVYEDAMEVIEYEEANGL
jgi:hypothetical protein